MADMALSLVQSVEPGPPEVRGVVRSHNSRQAGAPKEFRAEPNDGAMEVECRPGKGGSGAERGLQPADVRAPDAVDATVPAPRPRAGRRDFRNLLENRLASPETQSSDSKQEGTKQIADHCWPAFSATQFVNSAVDIEVFPEAARQSSQHTGLAPERRRVADLQIPPNDRTAVRKKSAHGSGAVENNGAARTGSAELAPLKDKGTLPDQAVQNTTSVSKGDLPERNTERRADDTEMAARMLESRSTFKSHIATEHVKEEGLMPAALRRTAVQDSSMSPAAVHPERTGARAAVEQPSGMQENSSEMKREELPPDAKAARESTVLEGEALRPVPPGEAVSSRATDAAGEAAEALKGVQTAVRAAGAEQTPAAVAQVQPRVSPLAGQNPSPAEQIIESIRLDSRGPLQEVDIKLNPAELGMIRMKFQHADGEVRGLLFVEKPQTRYEVEKELPQIIASLQHHGIQIRRLEVVANQQQYQHNDSQGTQGNVFAEADSRRNSNGNPHVHGEGEMSENRSKEKEEMPPVEYRITDDAINVYV